MVADITTLEWLGIFELSLHFFKLAAARDKDNDTSAAGNLRAQAVLLQYKLRSS